MLANLQVFETRDALMAGVAAELTRLVGSALAERGQACVALSGGATPAPGYERFAASPLEWDRITFLLVDERFAPPDHAASNEGMLRRALARAIERGAQLLPMYAANTSLDDAAARADALYAPRRIDVALMGMGEDGHTASWFPGADGLAGALDLKNPRTVIAQRAPQATGAAQRLTLTRAAVARAGAVILLLTGAAKRARLEAALDQPPETAPVAALFRAGPAPSVMWAR
jgi:6-phosphogluconolactonase